MSPTQTQPAPRSRLAGVFRALGSLLPRRRRDPGDTSARIVRPWREDAFRTYPTVGLTPSRALALLQAADGGHPASLFELFHEMLQKWPRLAAVEATRRLALTGLDWEITPHDTPGMTAAQRGVAETAAEVCRAALGRLDVFRDALGHLAHCIGAGLAVAELVWENGQLIDITPVPHNRFVADPHDPWRIRIRTEDEPALGVALDEQPNKWLIHAPQAHPGRPFDGGLLRASVLLYIAQNTSFKDWLIYSQIAGMPLRVARYDPATSEAEKQQILQMLAALGTDAVAALSKSVELSLVEPRQAEGPYQPLQDYCNTEVTILWLGQHLTTDIKSSGSRAAAEVHDRVREDLLVQDIVQEGRTVRRDVLTPIVRAVLGEDAPPPHFRRSLIQSVDTKVLADTLAVAVNQLGLTVPAAWVHKALGIPEAVGDAPTLRGMGR